MSAAKSTYLICDDEDCFEVFGFDRKERNCSEQRKEARKEGWVYSAGKDYCPSCRPKTKTGINIKSKSQQ